ncbi:MAG TPA: glycosyltransferase family 2 protein [Thermoanaerobaculia bacterium]|nr:glycosyltransferase family 2 protein [Thermoanaerobaculia bacterium]
MSTLLWAICILWVVTLVTTLLNLASVSRLQPRQPRRFPRVSIVVPARDEERTIERTVRALLAQTYPELEIIVVNDRSVDRTGEILAGFPGITVVDNEEPPPGWLGKPWALHQGSLRATGELLLFVDADVIYEPPLVATAVAYLEERGVALLSLFPDFEAHGFWEHVAMPNLAVFGFSFLPLWLGNRTRIVRLAIGGGTGNLVRRDLYLAAGGHEALQDAVVDDVGMARLMRREGHHTELVRAETMVRVRMYHGLREIVDGFTKNAFSTFDRSYLVAVPGVVLTLLVHLLPYAMALTGNAIALATVGLITLTRVILFRSLGYRLDNALFGHPPMIVIWCAILVRSMWMTGIRRRVHWRGRTYDADRTKFGAE